MINGLSVLSLVYGGIIITLASNLLLYVFYPYKPKMYFSFHKVKGMINFGINVMAGRLLWYWASMADVFIVGKFMGSTLLSYYSLASQFTSIPNTKIVSLILHRCHTLCKQNFRMTTNRCGETICGQSNMLLLLPSHYFGEYFL